MTEPTPEDTRDLDTDPESSDELSDEDTGEDEELSPDAD